MCVVDDYLRYAPWREGQAYFDNSGLSAPFMPTVCSVDPVSDVPAFGSADSGNALTFARGDLHRKKTIQNDPTRYIPRLIARFLASHSS